MGSTDHKLGLLVICNLRMKHLIISSIPSGRLSLLPLAVAVFAAVPASAQVSGPQLSDTIHPFVSLGYTYDNNLLRLPDGVSAGGQRSDRIRQSQAGVLVERAIGRQKLTGSAKISRVKFDHFEQLDYSGKDFQADLAWQLGNHLEGNLGGTYERTLTPFADFQSTERNLRTQRREYLNGGWRFHPSWRLRGGYTSARYEYELLAQRASNRTEKITEVGIDYLAASGSRIGLVARRLDGHYPTPYRVGGIPVQSDYIQDELKLNVWWALSGMTQVQALAGYARREREFDSTRDASGANGRVTVRWAPTGKLKLTADAWREFAAVESTFVSSSLNKGASLGAVLDVTSKVQANASLRTQTREFEQLSNIQLATEPSDRTRSASVGIVYSPRPGVQLSLSAFHDRRDGRVLGQSGDYKASGASFSASGQF